MPTNLAPSSAACPFCKGAVTQDTLQFGGNCPHCMLEIPGEEAPTDPGLAARQRKEAEDRVAAQKAARKRRMLTALGSLAAVGAIVLGYVEIQRREAALEYEVPDYPMLDLSAIPDDPEPVAAPAPNPNGTGKPTVAVPRPHTGNGGTTGSADAAAPAAPNAGTVRHDGGDNAPAPDATMQLHTSDAATASTGASMSSGDTVLKDEDEIIAMVKRLRRSYRPQVENCYNQRLKTAGDLAGVWKLTFTINRDGSVSNVGARGTSTKDGELEACMIKQASAWRFQKIAAALPVTDQYTFSPSE